MKKLATKLTPAIKQWIVEKFEIEYYNNCDGNRFFHYPNYCNYKGFQSGNHAASETLEDYTLVSEQEFLKEFSTKQKQMKPTTLSLELATIMYNGTDEQLKAFALENYPELAPKKSWEEELKREDYYISSNEENCFIYYQGVGNTRFLKHTLSQKQAKRLSKKFTIEVEMTRFAELRNDGWVANYNNHNQEKWGIWDYNSPSINLSYEYASFCFGIAVKSKEIAEEMLEIFGERIIECY